MHITTTTCIGSKSGGLDEEPKQKAQSNLQDFLPETIFQQQGLMDILAKINEMNEEKILIEIDLSMDRDWNMSGHCQEVNLICSLISYNKNGFSKEVFECPGILTFLVYFFKIFFC